MKKLFKIDRIMIFALAVLVLASGCKKLLEVPPPVSELPIAKSFSDSITATAVVTGIYARAVSFGHSAFENGGITLNNSLSSDDLRTASDAGPYEAALVNAADGTNDVAWIQAYETVLQINQAIDGFKKYSKLTATLQNQLLGECYFTRAYWYFYINQYWGTGAALAIAPDLDKNKAIANNNTQADFYNQMVTDLKLAETLLTDNYPSAEKARPNRKAASAMLARVDLYMGNYQGAADEATKVIGSGQYNLMPIQGNGVAANAPFRRGSTETIWQLRQNAYGESLTSYGSIPDAANFKVYSSYSIPTYYLRPELINSFDKTTVGTVTTINDLRLKNWIMDVTYTPYFGPPSSTHYFTPLKYTNASLTTSPTEYYVCLRSAEQYLIRAEANAMLNNIPAAVADLNIIRQRAFVSGYAGTNLSAAGMSQAACMAAVQLENRHEYFCEWGHRWADLKRWRGVSNSSITLADELLPLVKPQWKPESKLYPVPLLEIQADPNLKQNPGY